MNTKLPSVNTAEFSAEKKLSDAGTTLPRYFCTSSGCSRTASLIGQKITPDFASVLRKVVATDTLSNTASTAISRVSTPAKAARSRTGMPSLSYMRSSSGSTSFSDAGPGFLLGAA